MLKHIEIILKMKNCFDYVEFTSVCNDAGINVIPASEFAQKAGMLMVGMFMFPNVLPAEAYLKFIERMNEEYRQSQNLPAQTQPCGTCGDKSINNGGVVK